MKKATVIERFWRDESGPEMVEWAVVTVVLLTFTAGAIIALQAETVEFFKRIFEALQEEPPDSFVP